LRRGVIQINTKNMLSSYPLEVQLYEEPPNYKVASLRGPGIWKIDGEDFDELNISTRSISTYPLLPGGEKDGDPIADRLFVQAHENRALLAVADGCNWGRRPQMAARDAVAALSGYFNDRQNDIRDLQDAGHFLLRSFSEAHNRIVLGKEDIWEAGTTTLLGVLMLELEPANAGDPKWGLLCGSVGDCKAFLVNKTTRTVTDITLGNRNNVVDTRDPGGRLGPYVGHGWPDLRNLRLYFAPAEEGDIIVVMSDGVHDNFDAQTLGKLPHEISLPQKTWEEFTTDGLLQAKADYMRTLFGEVIFADGDLTPKAITDKIMKYCWNITSKSREFMEKNPNKKQPTDYKGFPGKMDHTTCITFLIGNTNNNKSLLKSPSTQSQPSPSTSSLISHNNGSAGSLQKQ